jgi:hypothetical protein
VQGLVVLTEFDHRPLPVPLRLHITAAWRLFLVHLEEAVRTAKPGETELHLDRTGVVSRAANA